MTSKIDLRVATRLLSLEDKLDDNLLDRINKINRILAWRTGETGGRLGVATQTTPKADLNSPASPALPA